MRFNKLICLFILLISIGCAPVNDEDLTGEISEIFGFAYEAVLTRDSGGSWDQPVGDYNMLFTGGDGATEGVFTQVFASYADPFCPIGSVCNCTGRTVASFKITNSPGGSQSSTNPYSIFDDESSSDNGISVSVDGPKIYTYFISLTFTSRTLSDFCRSQPDRILTVYRFENGDVIIQDGTKQTAMKVKP